MWGPKKNPFQKHKEEQEAKQKARARPPTPRAARERRLTPQDPGDRKAPTLINVFEGVKTGEQAADESEHAREKRRAIDELKAEIQRRQSARGSSSSSSLTSAGAAADPALPSSTSAGAVASGDVSSLTSSSSAAAVGDDEDPNTTNLYVANLAPSVDEERLTREFGRYGAVASVKVMWPRGGDEAERGRARHCGFVAFMRREDAELAKRSMSSATIEGLEIKLQWSKAVPLPVRAAGAAGAAAAASGGPGAAGAAPQRPAEVVVKAPKSAALIDRVARFVYKNGHRFEHLLVMREGSNPEYKFLLEAGSDDNNYYRWRVFSLLQGDTEQRWRTSSFQMFAGGPVWVPPPCARAEREAEERRARAARRAEARSGRKRGGGAQAHGKKPLGRSEARQLDELLLALTAERERICEAMAFALDHADSSYYVVRAVVKAIALQRASVPARVARLYLVSDILHNSASASVHNAFAYRSHFQEVLPEVFGVLAEVYAGITGRITALGLKEQVLRVLRVWEQWSLYPPQFISNLENVFSGKVPAPAASDTASEPAAKRSRT
eukprot:m51a1_g8640 putative u2 snrnp-associated surp motif-containing (554) ;mRNA; r:1399-3713